LSYLSQPLFHTELLSRFKPASYLRRVTGKPRNLWENPAKLIPQSKREEAI
jgi:hypothetical protein